MGRGAEGKSNEPWNPDTQSTFLYLGSLPWWWDLDTFQDREEHKYDESTLIEHLLCTSTPPRHTISSFNPHIVSSGTEIILDHI